MALVSPAPSHHADGRRRPDTEKWKSAEKVEIKNCFNNDTFQVCSSGYLGDELRVLYKVKTDSEGKETHCKARLNCDGQYQNESTFSYTSTPTSRFTINVCAGTTSGSRVVSV